MPEKSRADPADSDRRRPAGGGGAVGRGSKAPTAPGHGVGGPAQAATRPGAPRAARPSDLPGIVALEEAAFQPWRRSSRESLRRSLASSQQSVWVMEAGKLVAASLVLWHHPQTVRVYGIAVHPTMQGRGLGREMMRKAEAVAAGHGAQRVVLEADADDAALLAWYEAQGYRRVRHLASFYEAGRDAWRLEKLLK